MRRTKEKSGVEAEPLLRSIQLHEESIQTKTELADALYYAIFGGGGGAIAGMIFGTIVTHFAGLQPDIAYGGSVLLSVGAGLLLAHRFDPAKETNN